MSEVPMLRFGVAGTGYWALQTHAPAIIRTTGIELAAIWGRNAGRVLDVAERLGVRGILDFDDFLDEVDAVSFAVPPEVQSSLALRAIRAGKHVLLEKPIAVSLATAEALASAATENTIASVTFFTPLFDPRIRKIVNDVSRGTSWTSGHSLWLGNALADGSPFNTPWRHVKGALWDLGPHALATLWATLGPIQSVIALRGKDDLVHLSCTHQNGTTSTTTMTLNAGHEAEGFSMMLWGTEGRLNLPIDDLDVVEALVFALTSLADNIWRGVDAHPYDVHFGRDIVRLLAEVEQSFGQTRPMQEP